MLKLVRKKIFTILSSKFMLLISTKTYDVGTQKNCLNETAVLSTRNIYVKCLRKYQQFYAKKNVYLMLCNEYLQHIEFAMIYEN